MSDYEIVVIGAGPGGYVAAIRAAQLGYKVAIIDKNENLGGTCLNVGCIPTKAMLQSAHVFSLAKHAGDFGIEIKEVSYDAKKMFDYRDSVVKGLNKGVAFLMNKNKIKVVIGTASFEDSTTLKVGEDKITAKVFIVATGSTPAIPPGMEPDGKMVFTSDDIFSYREIPDTMLVIGGGAIGVEFASFYSTFGTKVLLVEMLPRLVPIEDEEISKELEKIFVRKGIVVRTGTKVVSLKRGKTSVEVTFETSDGRRESQKFSKVLVGVGRRPNTNGLGIEKTKVQLERGQIKTNGYMKTDDNNIYAIGDVTVFPKLAHLASAQGIIAVHSIKGIPVEPFDPDKVTGCTFCDPQVASIGLTEAEARKRGFDVKIGKFPFSALGMSQILKERDGFVKIVADAKYKQILGIHIIHAHASYLAGEMVAAVYGETPADLLAHAIHPHPTLSEAVMEALHAVEGSPIHN